MVKYEIVFLEDAKKFLDKLDKKSRDKVMYNIWKSREINDPQLFKKLSGEIWEFRTKFSTKQIRLLAFWDRNDKHDTLVIATNGFIKKSKKTPKKEIEIANKIMKQYFDFKNKK